MKIKWKRLPAEYILVQIEIDHVAWKEFMWPITVSNLFSNIANIVIMRKLDWQNLVCTVHTFGFSSDYVLLVFCFKTETVRVSAATAPELWQTRKSYNKLFTGTYHWTCRSCILGIQIKLTGTYSITVLLAKYKFYLSRTTTGILE